MRLSRSALPERRENGRENSRKKLERHLTARGKPEMMAKKTMRRRKNFVRKRQRQKRWN